MTPRAHHDLPFPQYQAMAGTNSSSLADLAVSPLLYRHHKRDVCDACGFDCLGRPDVDELGLWHCPECGRLLLDNSRPDTPDLRLGRLAHSYILEPDLVELAYAVYTGPTSGKGSRTERKEFEAEAAAAGKTVISAEDRDACLAMRRAVYSDPLALRYIAQLTEAELSIQWEHHTGELCKCRLDGPAEAFTLDLKTTRRDNLRQLFADFARFGYHCQGALYQDGREALTGERLPYVQLAVQKVAPWDVAVCPVPADVLEVGRAINEERVAQLRRCREERQWLGMAGGEEQPVELPAWADPLAEDDLICEGDDDE